MRCKLTTIQLMAYLDGSADSAVNQHMATCKLCQRRARELGQAQEQLRAKLNGNDCPTTMRLGEYHLRYASVGETRTLRTHIKGCVGCLNRLNEIAQEVDEQGAGQASSGYSASRQPAINLAGLVAYPQFDPSLLAQGVRGATAETTMNYPVGEGRVSLRLQPGDDTNGTSVTGLILGLDFSFANVRLLSAEDNNEIARVAVNRLGGFTLDAISSGAYEIELKSDDGDAVMLRELNL